MKRKRNKAAKIIAAVFILVFLIYDLSAATEELKEYLTKISPILTSVQLTARQLTQKLLPLEGATKEMEKNITSLSSFTPPVSLARPHKMLILSFKKMRMGFLLLSRGDKVGSARLVKSGRDLLRSAVKYILDVGRKEGIIDNEKLAE